ncbi:uridine kinase family protein [Hamadaea tsunoensis]|uniref:uridine kinase family protein n=1 Tax=Hamadaea tsunoensis TaxID=53368 RepID=UPI0004004AC1|nr:(d)CMP kinase [Hamadaea tsunoensis]
MTAADSVLEHLAARTDRPLIVAVDGHSAAGTSTLGRLLADRLGVTLVQGDDFYREAPDGVRRAWNAAEGVDLFFDWQRLRREVLEPLKEGRTAAYQPYSWRPEGGLADETVELKATPIVIFEGVYAARPEYADLLGLTVFVETPAEERLRRLHERGHGNDDWWPHWDAAEEHYYRHIRPQETFDLVVPGY